MGHGLLQRVHKRVVRLAYVVFRNVGGVYNGLRGQKEHATEHLLLLFVRLHGAYGLARFKVRLRPLQQFNLAHKLLVSLGGLAGAVYALFNRFKVGKYKLYAYCFNVSRRIDGTINMHYVFILKAAHNVNYCVNLAYMRKELVAKALALVCAAHKAGYIHKFYGRGRIFFGIVHFCQHVQPLVRHGDGANVWLYRTERIIGRLRTGLGYCIEQRAFANVWQTHHTKLHICVSPKNLFYIIIDSAASLVKCRCKRYTYNCIICR